MANKRVIRDLRQGMESRTIVRVERSAKYSDPVSGIVLRVGDRWIIMAQTMDGGYFNGYVAFRVRDVSRVRPDTSFESQFAKTQPEWALPYPFDLDLDSASSVVHGLANYAGIIGVQEERTYVGIWIGTLDEVTEKYVFLNEIQPDATWRSRLRGYKLRSITWVEVGTRYLVALSAIAGPRPEVDRDK